MRSWREAARDDRGQPQAGKEWALGIKYLKNCEYSHIHIRSSSFASVVFFQVSANTEQLLNHALLKAGEILNHALLKAGKIQG